MPRKQSDQQPIDNTDSEGGETDVAVAEAPQASRQPSPLDQALRATRPQHPTDAASLWMEAREQLTTPPMAFNPLNVTAAPQYGEEHASALEPAVTALTALNKAAQAVLDVRNASQSDPSLTQAAAVLQAAAAADKLLPAAVQKVDAAVRSVDAQVRSIESALAAPLTSGGNSTSSAELRSVVRSMPLAERMSTMQAAIAAGDDAVASAVLGAHPLLSGLTADAVKAMTLAWHRARNPEQVQKLALLKHTADALHRAGQQYILNMEGLQGVRNATVQRIRLQTGKARAVIGALLPGAA